ncbi:MAG: exodeoxyribonuclease VII large subunit [Cytophagales bacterium]|nr:exodeoxyribonuclease VII large subunit [Cytophagales bacterium]
MTSPDLFSQPERATSTAPMQRQAWRVGALCLAIADSLQARFNPLVVQGEVSNFSRAASGHCYFTLKDDGGQLRAAMFKRAATGLQFLPQDGQQVEVTGRLSVYEQRGELQLVVESMRRLGQGTLLEAFLRLKTKLDAAGLFSPERKRSLRPHPRAIGVVTSPTAAAWHDVMTALQRRVPHIPVILSPALVQGGQAPASLIAALHTLYAQIDAGKVPLDVILLVRGGGSLEDLWAFNDEQLAYTIAQSPVPVICGVGHEIDFSIADFVADVRAPTPTAAAELCAVPAAQTLSHLALQANALRSAIQQGLERRGQMLDVAARRLMQPSAQLRRQADRLVQIGQRLHAGMQMRMQAQQHRLAQCQTRLGLLHPQKVLDRGFAWVMDEAGAVVTDADKLTSGQGLAVHLAKGVRQVQVA